MRIRVRTPRIYLPLRQFDKATNSAEQQNGSWERMSMNNMNKKKKQKKKKKVHI